MSLQDEIDAFHKQMRARALLIAIEWAGSASELGRKAGGTRYAGTTWVRRGFVPVTSAKRLAKLPGFPLTALELTIAVDDSVLVKRKRCPHCMKNIRRPGHSTGCSPSFNRGTKRPRKKPAPKQPGVAPKHKPRAAKSKPA